jgi:hypothetical protein
MSTIRKRTKYDFPILAVNLRFSTALFIRSFPRITGLINDILRLLDTP